MICSTYVFVQMNHFIYTHSIISTTDVPYPVNVPVAHHIPVEIEHHTPVHVSFPFEISAKRTIYL